MGCSRKGYREEVKSSESVRKFDRRAKAIYELRKTPSHVSPFGERMCPRRKKKSKKKKQKKGEEAGGTKEEAAFYFAKSETFGSRKKRVQG